MADKKKPPESDETDSEREDLKRRTTEGTKSTPLDGTERREPYDPRLKPEPE